MAADRKAALEYAKLIDVNRNHPVANLAAAHLEVVAELDRLTTALAKCFEETREIAIGGFLYRVQFLPDNNVAITMVGALESATPQVANPASAVDPFYLKWQIIVRRMCALSNPEQTQVANSEKEAEGVVPSPDPAPAAGLLPGLERAVEIAKRRISYAMPISCPDNMPGCCVAHSVSATRDQSGPEVAAEIRAEINRLKGGLA